MVDGEGLGESFDVPRLEQKAKVDEERLKAGRRKPGRLRLRAFLAEFCILRVIVMAMVSKMDGWLDAWMIKTAMAT